MLRFIHAMKRLILSMASVILFVSLSAVGADRFELPKLLKSNAKKRLRTQFWVHTFLIQLFHWIRRSTINFAFSLILLVIFKKLPIFNVASLFYRLLLLLNNRVVLDLRILPIPLVIIVFVKKMLCSVIDVNQDTY